MKSVERSETSRCLHCCKNDQEHVEKIAKRETRQARNRHELDNQLIKKVSKATLESIERDRSCVVLALDFIINVIRIFFQNFI